MLEAAFVAAVLAGALLAVPFLALAARHSRPVMPIGVGLVVAALVYVALAAVRADASTIWLELSGTAAFAAVAVAGVRWSAWFLAAGWVAHVGWDLLLHPVSYPGYAPGWYPALCVGFDMLVAGFALACASGAGGR